MSEDARVVDGRAIPAASFELKLALVDAETSTATDVWDVVLVEVAQLGLSLRQSLQVDARQLFQRLARVSAGETVLLRHQRVLAVLQFRVETIARGGRRAIGGRGARILHLAIGVDHQVWRDDARSLGIAQRVQFVGAQVRGVQFIVHHADALHAEIPGSK